MKILVVEDEPKIGDYLRQGLQEAGFSVDLVRDGLDGAHVALTGLYELLILDVMLPGLDGWGILRRVRAAGNEVPVLFLTARDQVDDRVRGLELGADDYLVKPFEFAELLARLRALGRRSSQKIQQDVVQVGEFTMDRTSKILKKKDQVIQLSPREFQIFDLLAQNIGIVVPRDIILDRIWGLESEVSSNNIDSYVKLIRKKLDLGEGKTMIHTIRGVGYKLEAE